MSQATHTFELDVRSSNLPPFRQKLRSLLEASSFDAKALHDVILSVDEVLANVIRHAYGGKEGRAESGKIRVTFSDRGEHAEIVIQDEGPCFDPRSVPAPELPSRKPGGLGIYLVRSLMDEIHYEALSPRGNRLRLIKYKKGKGEIKR